MSYLPLPRSFYERDTTEVARDLLGRILAHRTEEGELAGIIVETEAYGPGDPANHAFRGPNDRNRVMFGPPGRAYVYLIYGRNWCVNAVTGGEFDGEAVLIRALQPIAGVDRMRGHRGVEDVLLLCRGPGNLCRALGITGAHNGSDLTAGPLTISGQPTGGMEVAVTPRVGIRRAADRPWRFCIAGSPFVSRGGQKLGESDVPASGRQRR